MNDKESWALLIAAALMGALGMGLAVWVRR